MTTSVKLWSKIPSLVIVARKRWTPIRGGVKRFVFGICLSVAVEWFLRLAMRDFSVFLVYSLAFNRYTINFGVMIGILAE